MTDIISDQTHQHSELMEHAPFHSEVAEGPADGTAYWTHADDKIRLRVGLWKTEKASRGTVLMFPGRSEYIENYGRTAVELGNLGLATFAIDWRGHGLSDRLSKDPMIGHVVRFSDYQKDVRAMIKAAEDLALPKPWYLIGHSMGACIGLRAVINGLPVAACAFTSPMWDIKMSSFERGAAWPLSWAAQALGKGDIYVPGVKRQTYVLSSSFEGNKMTHDPDMYQYWVNQAQTLPDLPTAGPSMGWLFEALKECRSLSKISSPDVPCIVFCADKDEDINIGAIQGRMKGWPRGRCELFQNSKHELFLETPDIRKSVMAKIGDVFAGTDV
jgi:lysophospholipase